MVDRWGDLGELSAGYRTRQHFIHGKAIPFSLLIKRLRLIEQPLYYFLRLVHLVVPLSEPLDVFGEVTCVLHFKPCAGEMLLIAL